jgi:hypothetical protein
MLAAGLVQPDPDRTRGRMGHLHRQIWKKFAAYEDRCIGAAGWPDAETRRRTIRARINKWAGECAAAERRGELGE